MIGNYSHSKYHSGVNPSHPGFKTRPPHEVFPEDIDCVFEGKNHKGAIFIGNLQAAESLETLKKHKITSILTACKNVHIKHPKAEVPYSLYIPGEDHQNYDLSLHFENAVNFIHESRKQTNILVHCMAGVSRSVTLVIAYLIKHFGMSYHQAFNIIKRKRNKANPNPGFVRQLERWEQKHRIQKSKSRLSPENSYNNRSFDPIYSKKYESSHKNRPLSYYQNKDIYDLRHRLTDGHRFAIFNPPFRNNPEFYNQNNQNISLKQRLHPTSKITPYQTIIRSPSYDRFKEIINVPEQRQNISFHRQRNFEGTSRAIDSKIEEIKKKYCQISGKGYNKLGNMNFISPKGVIINNFVDQNLIKRSLNVSSLRNSLYAPYNVTRSYNYQF